MKIIIGLIIAHLVKSEMYKENFYPPIWRKATLVELNQTGSVFLGNDEVSGCTCRTFPESYSFCYGRSSCKSFPKNVTIPTKEFRLHASQIFEIKPGDLNDLTHLEVLEVFGNYNLTRVLSQSFLGMTKLKVLSISYNANFKILEPHSFEGLLQLRHLILKKNAFTQLGQVVPALTDLPKLSKLELSENHFEKIKENDFRLLSNSTLYELNMVLCQIDDVELKAFNSLKNLTILRLGENSFSVATITRLIEEATLAHIPLETLNLYSIGLRKNNSRPLLEAIAKSNISNLCLAKNQIEVINSETFPKMPNIKILDLREMLTLNITNNAFVGLPNLKTLLLNGNKLNSIPEGVLLEQLTSLDLQQNSGSRLSPSYFSLYGEKFINMKNLQYLDLSFNAIHAIYNTSFVGLQNLRVLGLRSATIFLIVNGTFANLSKLEFLNLENNPFLKNHPLTLEQGLFNGLRELKVLRLGGCGVTFISKDALKGLKNLIHLGLERNKLTTLPNFEILVNLQTIDLSQNSLKPWYDQVFCQNANLKDADFSGNKFAFLTSTMVLDFSSLINLDLTNNPFTCDCTVSWGNKKIMDLIQNQTIYCAFPDSTTSLTIKEFLEKKSHCHNLVILILPVVILFSLLLALIFSLYYFRWHWRYWLFLTRLHLSRNRKIRPSKLKGYTNFIYDAFVSYSSEDRNFVIRLVTMLENYPPFIKLCVYERDFEVGTMISENVLECVAKSRKTLLIISNSYAKSQWCRWESQIAEHHRLFFQDENGEFVDDSLILIKLGPVNDTYKTPTLKYLLKTRIYLQWDEDEKKQKIFWEKLRGVLTPPVEINENTYL